MLPCGRYSRKTLIEFGLYYRRPASELIFLTRAEHFSIHSKGRAMSAEARAKISAAHKGKRMSEETKAKIAAASALRKHSAEERAKISAALKGKPRRTRGVKRGPLSAETRAKMSVAAKKRLADPRNHPMYGKHFSEESKAKNSASHKGRVPWNKGLKA